VIDVAESHRHGVGVIELVERHDPKDRQSIVADRPHALPGTSRRRRLAGSKDDGRMPAAPPRKDLIIETPRDVPLGQEMPIRRCRSFICANQAIQCLDFSNSVHLIMDTV
jgi:hypothetical protein